MGEDFNPPSAKRPKLKLESQDSQDETEIEEGIDQLETDIDFTENFTDNYSNFVTEEELEKLREFKVLDEVKSNDEDSNDDDSDSSDAKSEGLPEEEIEKMLEEGLPENFKGVPKPKERPYVTRQKIVLEEKGVNHFDVLPLDWMMVRHYSGMPVYMHRATRVCTLSKPYCLGKGNTRRHEIPISAIPCLAYRKALEEEEKQKEIDRRIQEQIKNGTWGTNFSQKENSNSNLGINGSVNNSKDTPSKCPFMKSVNKDNQTKSSNEDQSKLKNNSIRGVCKEMEINKGEEDFTGNVKSSVTKVDKLDTKDQSQNVEIMINEQEIGNNEFKVSGNDSIDVCKEMEIDSDKNLTGNIEICVAKVDKLYNKDESQNVDENFKIEQDFTNDELNSNVSESGSITVVCKEAKINSDKDLTGNIKIRLAKVDEQDTKDQLQNVEETLTNGEEILNNEQKTLEDDQEFANDVEVTANQQPSAVSRDSPIDIPLNRQPVVLPGGIVMPPPRVETVNTRAQHLTHEQMYDYCKKLFKFKTVNIMHFQRWADRRKYNRARKALQYPTLPEGTKLITIPAQPANGQDNGGKTTKRDCVMNMNGRSYLSVFHEYVRRALQKQPVYEFKQLENASSPYQATVYIGGMQYGVGQGSSKRQAKSAAARASIHILIPEMRDELDDDRRDQRQNLDEPDFSFFDCVGIEDPRITEFCAATCEPSPHAILRTCLLRNFGAGDRHIHTEMKKLEFQNIELTMKVGKHTATVVCKNKKTAKQRASQAILQALHPHVRSWGSLLRLYGSRSVKSCKEKKLEEQQITLLQDKARHNEPNYAVLEKLRHEMRKLRDRDAAVVPIGTLLLTHDLPSHSGSNLNNVDL